MRRRSEGTFEVSVRSASTVDADIAYELLTTGSTWPTWSPVKAFRLARRGDLDAEGSGAIRLLRISLAFVPVTCGQRVVERVPGRSFRYALAAGLPMRNYRGNVDLEPAADGARVHWHSTFRPLVPGSGWLCALLLERFIGQCVAGLVRHAASPRSPVVEPSARAW